MVKKIQKKLAILLITGALVTPTIKINALESIGVSSKSSINKENKLKNPTNFNTINRSKLTKEESNEGLIKDKNLEKAIRISLGEGYEEKVLTDEDLARVTDLNASGMNILSLSGLEYASGLENVDLSNNNISDIKPLLDMTFAKLNLSNNNITDISFLGKLGHISSESLDLSGNGISDISTIGTINLKRLNLANNSINDESIKNIEVIEGQLYADLVDLSNNQLTKINDLPWTSVNFLYIDNNNIDDLSVYRHGVDSSNTLNPKADDYNIFEKFNTLKTLSLNGNKISNLSSLSDLIDGENNQNIEVFAKNQVLNYEKINLVSSIKLDNPIVFRTVEGPKLNISPDINGKVVQNNINDYSVLWEGLKNEKKVGFTFDGEFSKDYVAASPDPNNPGVPGFSQGVIVKYSGTLTQPFKTSGGGSVVDPNPDPKPPATSKTVILASGEKYTDVLTATVLGNEKDAPILLSQKDSLDEKTLTEIKRLNTEDIIISGGVDSVSEKVVNQLKDYKVRRIAGENRYETAVKIGNEVRSITGKTDESMLVDGTNFPDVITMSSLASQKKVPILITTPNKLEKTTESTIKKWGLNNIIIGGSYDSVSKDIENNLNVNKFSRLGGTDRYETAAIIGDEVRNLTVNKAETILVDGTNFPDGLTINSIAAKHNSPILLTTPKTLTKTTEDKIKTWNIKDVLIGGGYQSVSSDIESFLSKSGLNNLNRIAGVDRYETAVKISQMLDK